MTTTSSTLPEWLRPGVEITVQRLPTGLSPVEVGQPGVQVGVGHLRHLPAWLGLGPAGAVGSGIGQCPVQPGQQGRGLPAVGGVALVGPVTTW